MTPDSSSPSRPPATSATCDCAVRSTSRPSYASGQSASRLTAGKKCSCSSSTRPPARSSRCSSRACGRSAPSGARAKRSEAPGCLEPAVAGHSVEIPGSVLVGSDRELGDVELLRDQVGHAVGGLNPAAHPEQAARAHHALVAVEHVVPDHHVHESELVLEGQEHHASGGSG